MGIEIGAALSWGPRAAPNLSLRRPSRLSILCENARAGHSRYEIGDIKIASGGMRMCTNGNVVGLRRYSPGNFAALAPATGDGCRSLLTPIRQPDPKSIELFRYWIIRNASTTSSVTPLMSSAGRARNVAAMPGNGAS